MVTLFNVEKWAGSKPLFREVGLTIGPGDRVGVVGANGAGKSTLAALVLGTSEPDAGSVSRARSLRVGHLPQELSGLPDATVMELTLSGRGELEELRRNLDRTAAQMSAVGPARAKELARVHGELSARYEGLGGWRVDADAEAILLGLGFEEDDFDRPVKELSGGWAMRAALARVLLMEPDLIVLDEPTNHLDLMSQVWLEEFLQNTPAALFIISHDRTLLNNLVHSIAEIAGERVTVYSGDYEAYARQKEMNLAHLMARERKRRERIDALKNFIMRNRARKDRARQVQVRLRELKKLEEEPPPPAPTAEITEMTLPEPLRGPKVVAELKGVCHSFGPKPVLKGVDLSIFRGERLAVVGPNGSGKTTLLRIIAGLLAPLDGSLRLGDGVEVGYFSQNVLESLNPANTLFEEAATAAGDMSRGRIMSLLGCFLFPGDEMKKRVSVLSGGEKSRLLLLKLLMQAPGLLVLDEPTSHLDIPSRRALEEALAAYSGSLVLVSHDRRLIDRVARKVAIIEERRVELFPGNLADYLNIWKSRGQKGQSRDPGGSSRERVASRREVRKRKAEERRALAEVHRPLREEMGTLEERIERLSGELEELNTRLAEPETHQSRELLGELGRRAKEVRAQMDALTKRWEDAALELETKEKGGLASAKEV